MLTAAVICIDVFLILIGANYVLPVTNEDVSIEEHFPDDDINNQASVFMDIPVDTVITVNQRPREFEKKLIMIVTEREDVIQRVMHAHSDIIFLQHLSAFDSRSAIIHALYECQTLHLAVIVDYINANLLTDKRKPWCGSHKATKEYMARHSLTSPCTPISKNKVNTFCRNRHLAVQIAPGNAEQTIKDFQKTLSPNQLKIITESSLTDSHRRSLQQLSSQQDQTIERIYHEDQFVLTQDSSFGDILELFNYLDVHIPNKVHAGYRDYVKDRHKPHYD